MKVNSIFGKGTEVIIELPINIEPQIIKDYLDN